MDSPPLVDAATAWVKRNRFYLLATLLQLALFPFGLWYDTRIYFGTGAGVANGYSPYAQYDLGLYYHSPSLVGVVSGIGYAPPWALFLGAIYVLVYVPTQNVLAMNFAMKIPIIAGNLLLARFVRTALQDHGVNPTTAARAELLVLFNPFLLYTSTFWNMYDTSIALLTLVSLSLLEKDRPVAAGLALGASLALKHLALPLIPLGWLWLWRRSQPTDRRLQGIANYTSALLLSAIGFVFLPFYVFGWRGSGFVAATTYQTVAAGGFTVYNFIQVNLGGGSPLGFLGYLSFAAVIVAYVMLRNRPLRTFLDLTRFALIIMIVFMTTRTFVSDQNLAMIFPLVLFPELLRERGFQKANRFWGVFLVYTLSNSVVTQFPFLLVPDAFTITVGITTNPIFGGIRGVILAGCVLVWIFLGWTYIVRET